MNFEWYEVAMVFLVLIFTFLFRINGEKEPLDENGFHHCYDNFLKVT